MSLTKAPTAIPIAQPPSECRRPAVVIVDSGVSASLVVLCGLAGPALGLRFQYAGTTWQIIGYRHTARAFLAEPIEQ
jgi:hypothetical protein